MPAASAFEKRLKRQVVGRVREYFAVTAPGLEQWCLKELTEPPISLKEIRQETGGVAFKGRLSDCFRANLHLRTANRILMRIDTFKATNFGRFEKKTVQIPWEIYLSSKAVTKIHVSTHHCRLHHSGALKDRVENGIRLRMDDHASRNQAAEKETQPQNLFIRGIDDRFTISLDSSGDHLHRRGIKTQGAAAPLRETLAAAILKIAEYTPGETLIDPMCGAGTFSLEAAMATLKIPAGQFRRFAFEAWPAFRPARWWFIRNEAEKMSIAAHTPFIFASDRQGAACNRLSRIVKTFGFTCTVTVSNADFFDVAPQALTDLPGMVVLNPPYGRRLNTPIESRQTILHVCRHLANAYRGWKYALLIPKIKIRHRIITDSTTTPISHGGLNLTLLTGKIA